MKIIKSSFRDDYEVDVQYAIAGTIEDARRDRDGKLEMMQAEIDKSAMIIGFLAQKLVDHGLLGGGDLSDILSYDYKVKP